VTLNKQKITREIGRRTRLRNSDVEAMLSSFIDVLSEQLGRGGRIEIENFLVLEVKTRTRRAWLSRQPVMYRMLRVRPGSKLRAVLNRSTGMNERG
jgi:nucleoid DNA-binding protein